MINFNLLLINNRKGKKMKFDKQIIRQNIQKDIFFCHICRHFKQYNVEHFFFTKTINYQFIFVYLQFQHRMSMDKISNI